MNNRFTPSYHQTGAVDCLNHTSCMDQFKRTQQDITLTQKLPVISKTFQIFNQATNIFKMIDKLLMFITGSSNLKKPSSNINKKLAVEKVLKLLPALSVIKTSSRGRACISTTKSSTSPLNTSA